MSVLKVILVELANSAKKYAIIAVTIIIIEKEHCMNNSVALLYNFNEEKLKMIKMVCMMMQVRFKEVARAEYEQPLGALLGISGIENHGEVYQGEEFQEEMLVLHGFDGSKLQKFLIALQRVGVGRIELKAMITENNKSWNGLALYEELCQEREAFKKMEAERRNKVQK